MIKDIGSHKNIKVSNISPRRLHTTLLEILLLLSTQTPHLNGTTTTYPENLPLVLKLLAIPHLGRKEIYLVSYLPEHSKGPKGQKEILITTSSV